MPRVGHTAHPQWLQPVSQGLRGLQQNCDALGVQVGQAQHGGAAAGISLFASRSFQPNETIGYFWGVLLESEEHWHLIRDASPDTVASHAAAAAAAGKEDYWTPPMRGIYRCVAVPLQDPQQGGDHLLASEQCPMAYVNQASRELANIDIQFPAKAFQPGAADAYSHVSFIARRSINAGDELLTEYQWKNADTAFKEVVRRYNRYRADLARQDFAGLAPFDRLRAQDGKFAGVAAAASVQLASTAASSASVALDQLPPFVPVAVDGRMSSFIRERFMLWVPQEQDPMPQLCRRWVASAQAESSSRSRVNWATLGLQYPIRKGGNQLTCKPSHPLFRETEAQMRRVLAHCLGWHVESALYLIGLIQLSMQPGDGPMPYHTDQPIGTLNHRKSAAQSWSVLLYTSDCHATLLPRLTADEMDQATMDFPLGSARRLLQDANFFAGRARCGTTVVMRTDVPHASPQHHGHDNRITLYALFSPDPNQQIDLAYFPLGV